MRNKIRELLKDSPEAWADAQAHPDEMLAYGFQFWHAGELTVGPHAHGVLGWILKKFEAVNNWLRDQPSANQLLEQVKSGAFADGKPSPVEISLSKSAAVLKRVQSVTKDIFHYVDKFYDAALSPFDTRLRDTGVPALHELAQKLYLQVGENKGQRGMVQEIPAQTKRWYNALDKLQRMPGFTETIDQMKRGETPTDTAMAGKVRGWLDGLHQYGKDAGIDMGYVKDFLPMSWDGDKIAADKAGFIAMLERKQAGIDALNAELKAKSGKGDKFVPYTPESIAERMAKSNSATNEFISSVYDERGAPTADFVHDRVFSFLNNADRAPFIKDDVNASLQRYAKQMVNRAEWSRRFGEDSAGWNAGVEDAKKYGASKEQLQLLQDYKDAVFGVKLHDMNPTLRKFIGGMTVYQNYRVLSTSLLGSIIDPMGVAVRSGEWSEATNAYKLAISRIFKSGRDKHADLQGLAEDIGAMERAGVADSLHNAYGGVNIEGFGKKANELLFRMNGMSGLTRSVQMAALSAGISYVGRHAKGANEHSTRNLAELGLVASDVKHSADGRLAVRPEEFQALGMSEEQAGVASEKMQRALNRFVDESSLRPNVGERTKWGADPIFSLLYHLKQYVISYNKVINKKLEHELLEHGNVTPYLIAATYIPIMAGSGMIRDMIYNAGSLPPQKGFLDYVGGGFARSGLMGPSDLVELGVGGVATGNMSALAQLAGPTASQAMDGFGAISSASHVKSFGRFVAESLPGGNIAQHYLK